MPVNGVYAGKDYAIVQETASLRPVEGGIDEPIPRVTAHELAHAWQSFHAPSTQSLQIVEGFAEWVAYRVLLALGQQRDAARLTRRDDLYGKGLQYFIALEQRSGQQGVLQRARQV